MFGRLLLLRLYPFVMICCLLSKHHFRVSLLQHRHFLFVMVAVFDVSSQSTLQSSISDTARIGTCVRPFSSTNGCASGNTTSVLSTFTVTALPVSTVSFFGFAVGAVVSLGLTVAVGSCVGVTDDVGFNVSFCGGYRFIFFIDFR